MSASLVGSEMCIRDRLWPSPRLLPAPLPGDWGRSVERWGARAHGSGTGCLLYTSDAADDM
eukprot:9174716-Alexandrium_andersonii.AAC.1